MNLQKALATANGNKFMIDRLPLHAYIVAAVIASGAFWLAVSQIVGLFIN